LGYQAAATSGACSCACSGFGEDAMGADARSCALSYLLPSAFSLCTPRLDATGTNPSTLLPPFLQECMYVQSYANPTAIHQSWNHLRLRFWRAVVWRL